MDRDSSERGKPATFDRRSGAVHGSGSGAGGDGNPNEDYDNDSAGGGGVGPDGEAQSADRDGPRSRDRLEEVLMTGKGHPLPASDEARHGEIPEHIERDKGRGDDAEAVVQPDGGAVEPDGTPYSFDDDAD